MQELKTMRRLREVFGVLLRTGVVAVVTGCATTEVIDTRDDRERTTKELDYRDFEMAASRAVESMLKSGAVNHPGGGRYVMAVSRVINDTMLDLDTAQLTKKIRVELLNSGKVVVTTGWGAAGPEDTLPGQVRDGRLSEEVDPSTLPEEGRVVAPDLSLSGKIIQRALSMDRGRTQIEYYFQLTLTEVARRLALWEGETVIVKRTGSRTPW